MVGRFNKSAVIISIPDRQSKQTKVIRHALAKYRTANDALLAVYKCGILLRKLPKPC